MAQQAQSTSDFEGRPLVFRNATVISVDPTIGTLAGADVLVVDQLIAAVGPRLTVPGGTLEIDASGGILIPGLIDTHRHMYQTAMRGFGADWTLTDYFYFYYVNHGSKFRPQDVYAGNLLAAIEAVDSGVTTTLDWSHGLQTTDHAEAALDALERVPARFVFSYGNLAGAPQDWSTDPAFKAFVNRRLGHTTDMLSFGMSFDVPGDPEFPERAAFEVARELDVPISTHSGAWGATGDAGILLMAEHGFLTDQVTHVHVGSLSPDSYHRIAASGASASLATESEQNAGQGYPPSFRLREYGIPISLSMDTSVWWSADMFSAMRSTLNADRAREHLIAHEKKETVTSNVLRADDVIRYATAGGARAIHKDESLGRITVGRKADLVLIKNDGSPTMFPILNPEGHVVFQSGKGDIHTVVINGKVLKYDGKLLMDDLVAEARVAIAETVDYLQSAVGAADWESSRNPSKVEVPITVNPYQWTEFSESEAGRIG
ncbi:MAG: 5-methylthioadenosine/S-adenosylhomocysteine deaminase [Actinomycetota bacterium]|jgi:cytosine/adenosine deaminase-related metal-dependent hydrolase|nr:5-methylthioadenosine/S-adenosylhomocysteine deaminase [Actinomycetota bacterium]MDQ1562528.1 5-methylthioadenosine/S-adenosylhomocysteine deaminase [Actinomycetota bacterium]MDQ1573248.1 5-methylthioadenosine/S-adenosylhomocysteine deaminase [Actinomycetota bacterium]